MSFEEKNVSGSQTGLWGDSYAIRLLICMDIKKYPPAFNAWIEPADLP